MVILYFLQSVEGLFFKPKYLANIYCTCFNFIAVLFLFLSSPWGSVYPRTKAHLDQNLLPTYMSSLDGALTQVFILSVEDWQPLH